MKKISVNKSDEVAVIVEKIIEAPDEEIVLSIPRFSHLGGSLSNFNLLKREADALRKKVLIESVDDHIIELAEMSGLTVLNPFFAKNKRQFSDIVSPKNSKSRHLKPVSVFVGDESLSSLKDQFSEPEAGPEEEGRLAEESRWSLPRLRLPKLNFYWPGIGRRFYYSLAGILITVGLVYVGVKILPRAKVVIAAQTEDWTYNDSVTTVKGASLDINKMTIGNQLFSQKKNVSLKFSASGKRQIERKAGGTLTVYNSYSSDPQPLVVETRFMTPDGKIFRLTKNTVVPGAKIVEGKIVPSSIETQVAADKPGPDYNIGPVKLFTIPGFKGTAKYQAFYAESAGNMTGGFVGEISYPTDEDIKKAKANTQSTLESGLKTVLFAQVPKEFKILDGVTRFRILEQKVDVEADETGNFGIFTEAQLSLIAFKEEDLKMLLEKRAKHDQGEDFEVRSSSFEYGLARTDFEQGALSFPVSAKSVLAKRIDAEELKTKIVGKSATDLKTMVFGLPGLKSATISLWPFYVKTVPPSPNKITVIVE